MIDKIEPIIYNNIHYRTKDNLRPHSTYFPIPIYMKRFAVFLTTFLVLLSGISLIAVTPVHAQTSNYVLSNNQAVTALIPIGPSDNWNLVYQQNPSTPIISAIQYQPELHTFVTENVDIQPQSLRIAMITEEVTASISAQPIMPESIKAQTASPAAVITIDKSASIEAETSETAPAATPKPSSAPQAALPASELDSLFEKYAGEYGISAAVIKRIAQCESGMRPEALSSNGLYGGLFQFVSATWSSNRKAMGLDPDPNLRFNAEEAIKTAAFKMSRDGYGAWPVCGRKALAAVI